LDGQRTLSFHTRCWPIPRIPACGNFRRAGCTRNTSAPLASRMRPPGRLADTDDLRRTCNLPPVVWQRLEAFIISSGDGESCEISSFGEASACSGASFRYENGKDGVPQRQAQNIAFHYSTCGNTALSHLPIGRFTTFKGYFLRQHSHI
jgi:hypothetical protein